MNRRGFTLIELLVVIAITGVLASAFVGLFAPQVANFLYLPNQQNMLSKGSDLMGTLIDGDAVARGIRYAAPSPRGAAVAPFTVANANSLTYTYFDAAGTSRTVTLTYDPADQLVRRTVTGGPANQVIPVNFTAGSDVNIIRLENNSAAAPAFFRYYTLAGGEFVPTGSAASLNNIYRVQIAYQARSGAGDVRRYQGQMPFKSAVEIKDFRNSSSAV